MAKSKRAKKRAWQALGRAHMSTPSTMQFPLTRALDLITAKNAPVKGSTELSNASVVKANSPPRRNARATAPKTGAKSPK